MRKFSFGLMMTAGLMVAGCARSEAPVGQRAMAAYKAHDYKAALPLLKKWAATPEVMGDREQLKNVMAYIVDVELKTTGKVEDLTMTPAATKALQKASGTGGASPSLAALKVQAAVMAKEESVRMSTDGATGLPRVPHPPPKPGELLVMSIKQLGNFEFDPEKDSDVPADVKALNGCRIRLRGFMLPLTQATDVTDFALVPSLTNCCFGQPPGTQHIITCRIPKSKELEYITDEISVEGVLTVKVKREQDYTNSIFELDVTSVKLAE